MHTKCINYWGTENCSLFSVSTVSLLLSHKDTRMHTHTNAHTHIRTSTPNYIKKKGQSKPIMAIKYQLHYCLTIIAVVRFSFGHSTD